MPTTCPIPISAAAYLCTLLPTVPASPPDSGATCTFDSVETRYLGSGSRTAPIGDLDGDGDGDLVVANQYDNEVVVLLNDGNGAFVWNDDYRTGDEPVAVVIGDLNDDGEPDFASANGASGTVSVFLNVGNMNFARHDAGHTLCLPIDLATGDLDGDGDIDLVTANWFGDDVAVLLNHGDGTFAEQVTYPVIEQDRDRVSTTTATATATTPGGPRRLRSRPCRAGTRRRPRRRVRRRRRPARRPRRRKSDERCRPRSPRRAESILDAGVGRREPPALAPLLSNGRRAREDQSGQDRGGRALTADPPPMPCRLDAGAAPHAAGRRPRQAGDRARRITQALG